MNKVVLLCYNLPLIACIFLNIKIQAISCENTVEIFDYSPYIFWVLSTFNIYLLAHICSFGQIIPENDNKTRSFFKRNVFYILSHLPFTQDNILSYIIIFLAYIYMKRKKITNFVEIDRYLLFAAIVVFIIICLVVLVDFFQTIQMCVYSFITAVNILIVIITWLAKLHIFFDILPIADTSTFHFDIKLLTEYLFFSSLYSSILFFIINKNFIFDMSQWYFFLVKMLNDIAILILCKKGTTFVIMFHLIMYTQSIYLQLSMFFASFIFLFIENNLEKNEREYELVMNEI